MPVVRNLTGSGGIPLHVTPFAVVEVVVAGTIVTLVSAVFPAWRAGRTKPMVAMRTARVDRSGTNKIRAVIGLVMIVLGAALLLGGMAAKFGLAVGAGPVFLFLGTLIGGPALAKAFAMFVGRRPASTRPVVAAGRRQRRAQPGPHRHDRERAGHRRVPRGVRHRGGRGGAGLVGARGVPVLERRPHRRVHQRRHPGQPRAPDHDHEGRERLGAPVPAHRRGHRPERTRVPVRAAGGRGGLRRRRPRAQPRQPRGQPRHPRRRRGRRAQAARAAAVQQPEMGDKVTITFDNGVRKQFTIGAVFDFNLDIASYIVSFERVALASAAARAERDRPHHQPGRARRGEGPTSTT